MKPRSPIARKTAPRKLSAKKEAALNGQRVYSTITPKKTSGTTTSTKTGRMRRSSKPKARNAKRRASEYVRCYGSKERVEWVKSLPCVGCVAYWPIEPSPGWLSENAHTVTGGKGRKADANTIVPLCASHHRAYDRHRAPFDHDEMRERMKYLSQAVDAAWQRECARRGIE